MIKGGGSDEWTMHFEVPSSTYYQHNIDTFWSIFTKVAYYVNLALLNDADKYVAEYRK